MSNTDPFNQNRNTAVSRLPEHSNIPGLVDNFLNLRPNELQIAESQPRTMDDLRRGLNRLNGQDILTQQWVWQATLRARDVSEDAERHVARGAALAKLLTDESTDGLSARAAPGSERTFADVHEELSGSYNQRLRHPETYRKCVDAILEKAGLNTALETAVNGLTGDELLAPPTNLDEAKYGAAVYALATGMNQAAAHSDYY